MSSAVKAAGISTLDTRLQSRTPLATSLVSLPPLPFALPFGVRIKSWRRRQLVRLYSYLTALHSLMELAVLDGGTGFLKAGYAGQVSVTEVLFKVEYSGLPRVPFQNFPDHQYPSIVGRPILRTEEQSSGDIQLKDVMCGDEAAAARSMLQITYPVGREMAGGGG